MRPCVAVLCLLPLFAGAEEAASARAYQGPEGQRVEVVRLSPLSAGAGLVRIQRTGSPFDGLVLRCEVEDGRFTTRFHGGPWTVLRLSGNGGGLVFFPEVAEFRVTFTEDAVSAADLFAEHQRQRDDGRLAMFAKKEHPHLVRKYEAQALAETRKACPEVTAFTFDWATFTDEDMDTLDVWALCAPLVGACAPGVTQLTCRRGSVRALVRTGAKVTLTTAGAPR